MKKRHAITGIMMLLIAIALLLWSGLSGIKYNKANATELDRLGNNQLLILYDAQEATGAIRNIFQADFYRTYKVSHETEKDLIYLDYQIRRMMSHIGFNYRAYPEYEYSDGVKSYQHLFSRIRTDLINVRELYEDGHSEDGNRLLRELIDYLRRNYREKGISYGPHIPTPTFN